MKLGIKLIILFLAISLIPISILGTIHFQNSEEQIIEQTFIRLDSAALLVESKVNLEIKRQNLVMDLFTSRVLLRTSLDNFNKFGNEADVEQISIIINKTLKSVPDLDFIHILNNDRVIISSTDHLALGQKVPQIDITAESIHTTQINFVLIDDENGETLHELLSALLLSDDGRNLGSAILGFDASDVFLANQDIGLGETGEYVIAKRNKDGDALFITPLRFEQDAMLQKIIPKDQLDVLITQALLKNEQVFNDKIDYRGEPVFAITRYIEDTDWGLVVKIDQKEAILPIQEMKKFMSTTMIISFIISIFIAILFSKSISNPIKKIRIATKKIADGNFTIQLPIEGSDEIKKLSEDVNFMTKSLKKSNKELSNFKVGMDEADIVAKTDVHGNIIYVNNKFCEISKYSKEELLGQNHRILKSGYHSKEFFDNMWKTISSGKIWHDEIKNRAKDGSFYWVKTVITPIFDDNGIITEFLAIRTDITNRKKAEENLLNAITKIKDKEEIIKCQLTEIKKTDNLKDEFFSMISHELKSPLGPIMGYCELLKDHTFSKLDPIQSEAVDEIFDNAKRLEKIIGDVLDVQKFNMNQFSFNKTKFELNEFMKQLAKKYFPLMLEKQIQFKINSDVKLIFQTDKDRLIQVLDNLILNAVDFVPRKNGQIEVGLSKQDKNIVFCVKDNGIGISKEDHQHLFKKFYQIDTSYTRNHGGTGLGLVICKSIVEGLGGKIWVKSERGKGATFFFSLPISQIKEIARVIKN